MNLNDMMTAVRDLHGDTDAVQFTNAQLTRWINWAIGDVSRRLGNLVATVTFTGLDALTVDHGAGGIALPGSFIRVIDVTWNGTKLGQLPYEDMLRTGEAVVTSADVPSNYILVPPNVTSGVRRIVFYPFQAPSKAATITVRYVGRPVDLVAGTDVPLLPEDLHFIIVIAASYMVKMSEGDTEGAKGFKMEYIDQLMTWSATNIEVPFNTHPRIKDDAQTLYDLSNQAV